LQQARLQLQLKLCPHEAPHLLQLPSLLLLLLAQGAAAPPQNTPASTCLMGKGTLGSYQQ
jgi:hypothetical protein